jgi:hypothetical protein
MVKKLVKLGMCFFIVSQRSSRCPYTLLLIELPTPVGCGTMFRNWSTITFLLCLMLLFTVFGLLRIALPSQIEQATGIVVENCWNIVQHLFTLFLLFQRLSVSYLIKGMYLVVKWFSRTEKLGYFNKSTLFNQRELSPVFQLFCQKV